jgi:hypothetical protein
VQEIALALAGPFGGMHKRNVIFGTILAFGRDGDGVMVAASDLCF